MKNWVNWVGGLAAATVVLGAVYTATDALGVRFIYKFEHEQLAGTTYEYMLMQKRRRLFEVERAIKGYQTERLQVPFHLIKERDILRDEIADLRKRLGK